MSVRRATAYGLLKVFAELEFELKNLPAFIGSDGRNAKVDWPTVDRAIRALPPERFLDQVSALTRQKMLARPRNRPMVQQKKRVDGFNRAVFGLRNLPPNDAEALVVATRRVRNNLFHGGKEDPLAEPYPGDDQQWAVAALEVATWLVRLVRAGGVIDPP